MTQGEGGQGATRSGPGTAPSGIRSQVRVRSALFVVRDGRVLLAEHEKAGVRSFLLPGGGVDPGEGWAAAAARELGEELGVEAWGGPLLALFENRSPDGSRHLLHAVFAGGIQGEPRATGADARVIGCRWASASELPGLRILPTIGPVLVRWLEEGPPGGAECAPVEWIG